MTILKDFSIIWSLVHTLVMFLLLFESRYPKKKTLTLSVITMVPLIVINFIAFVIFGTQRYMKLMLITLSLPSLIFFWIMAKHRDGRFVFTFCMIDTIVLEIIYITNFIDNYIPGHWFLFTSRLVIYPLFEWIIYKRYKKAYQEIQHQVKRGWWLFAVIGIMFYVAITLAMSSNAIMSYHPEHMPILIILLMLMPLSYINIFNTLRHQQKAYSSSEQENILTIQVSDIKARIEEISAANDNFRTERHDFRHKLQTISRLVENKEYDELHTVVSKYSELIEETRVKRYCDNAVLDAVFSSYIRKAEACGITVTSHIAFPKPLPVNDVELATVFANAIENAINACEKIEQGQKFIDIKVIIKPKFMLRIENSFDGNTKFNDEGIPVTSEDGHGFGTRSIIAFCNKYNAFYEFKEQDGKFILQIMF